jgi:hypothetical protein
LSDANRSYLKEISQHGRFGELTFEKVFDIAQAHNLDSEHIPGHGYKIQELAALTAIQRKFQELFLRERAQKTYRRWVEGPVL